MYQAYVPGRGPYPTLFPIPLAHPSPLRPGESFLTGPGLIATTSAHSNAPILSIPSMAAFKAKIEKDNTECLNLVKKDSDGDEYSHLKQHGKSGQLPPSLKSQSQLQAAQRPVGPAEFTRFTIDEILGKNEETHLKEDPSDDDISCDEIEVVRCNTPDSESGKIGQDSEEGMEGESLAFGSANIPGDVGGVDDPSTRFSWLQCTRYKPPKLPRKFISSSLR